jgi:hypothetical protein
LKTRCATDVAGADSVVGGAGGDEDGPDVVGALCGVERGVAECGRDVGRGVPGCACVLDVHAVSSSTAASR